MMWTAWPTRACLQDREAEMKPVILHGAMIIALCLCSIGRAEAIETDDPSPSEQLAAFRACAARNCNQDDAFEECLGLVRQKRYDEASACSRQNNQNLDACMRQCRLLSIRQR